jgi:hypothetical protein
MSWAAKEFETLNLGDARLNRRAVFDAQVHGHWSCQRGPDPLVTLFVRG